jgi:hypothetical protein
MRLILNLTTPIFNWQDFQACRQPKRKHAVKKLVVVFILTLAAGCASHVAVMKNEQTGDVKTCETGTALAYTFEDMKNRHKEKSCVKALEKAGYKRQ